MSDRLDYFFRQKVSESELDLGFAFLETADRQALVDLGLIGVLKNAVVTEKSGTPDLTVDVSGSAAIHDKLGQRIGFGPIQNVNIAVDENNVTTSVLTPGNEKIVSVFAKFDRTLTDPRIDGNSVTVFFNQAESFTFVVRQGAETGTPPATPVTLDAEFILLAEIQRLNPQTQILNANITPPGGTYTAISQRREAAFVLSAGALSVLTGTPEESDQAILTELNTHITNVGNAHVATAITAAIAAVWQDGSGIVGTNVDAVLEEIVNDLRDGAGSDRVGANVYVAGGDGLIDLVAGSIQDQLRQLSDATAAHALAQTIAGAWTFSNTAPITFTGGGSIAHLLGPAIGSLRIRPGAGQSIALMNDVGVDILQVEDHAVRFHNVGASGNLSILDVTDSTLSGVGIEIQMNKDSVVNGDFAISRSKRTGTGAETPFDIKMFPQPGRDVAAGPNNDGGRLVVELPKPGTGGTAGTGRHGSFDLEALGVIDEDGAAVGDIKTKHFVLATFLDDAESITSWYLSPFGALAVGETEIVELTLIASDRPAVDAANNGASRTYLIQYTREKTTVVVQVTNVTVATVGNAAHLPQTFTPGDASQVPDIDLARTVTTGNIQVTGVFKIHRVPAT